ncbi:MAG TPA: right-handed parallel beta-helix repeat-containing protein [Actinomycetota bacterium]|nr:right-handed parallel beta-helix repeat-containing protein [Actinomycetota bacterium]
MAGAAAVVAVAAAWGLGGPAVVVVGSDEALRAAVRSLPAGSVVRLRPGTYGPFALDRPLTVEGEPGAVVRGPVTVRADGSVLRSLTVVGGESGVRVEEADGVLLEDLVLRGQELQGVEVSDASATVRGCAVGSFVTPYGQGVDVRNANGRPRTVVEGCVVSAGQEGLVSHVSRVEFRGNVVTGTTQRAIAVDEMSEGLVEGNVVRDVAGAGLYCGDMSNCVFRRNRVAGVRPGQGPGRMFAGVGVVAFFHSALQLDHGAVAGAAGGPVHLSEGARLVDRSPLALWPPGWRGAVPALWVAAASVAGLSLVRVALRPVGPLLVRRFGGRRARRWTSRTMALLGAGFAVQSFHMVEHVVQVVQVYVLQAEQRSGLLGETVDTEWLHLAFNLVLLGFLVWATALFLRHLPAALLARPSGLSFLLAAVAVQSYHLAEHVAKVAQHVTSGVRTAPGLLGDNLGLVWFHFGINLAVWVGTAVTLAALGAQALLSTGPGGPGLPALPLRSPASRALRGARAASTERGG